MSVVVLRTRGASRPKRSGREEEGEAEKEEEGGRKRKEKEKKKQSDESDNMPRPHREVRGGREDANKCQYRRRESVTRRKENLW